MTIMADNWLASEEMLAEVLNHCLKLSGGTMPLTVRCPDEATEKRVHAFLKGKRGGRLIDTYVGGINDPVKITKGGESTPIGDDTPVETDEPGDDTPEELDNEPAPVDTPPDEDFEGLF